MYSVILLSAGKGVRFGKDTPKQYLLLAGKPMIVHTLERLAMISSIDEIVVVCNAEYIETIQAFAKKYNIIKKLVFAQGGATRQDSVYNGLVKASNEKVIVHEAARPFVSIEDFEQLIDCPHDTVSFTYEIPYTVLKKQDNVISGILERSELVNIQLPQKFLKQDLLLCHEKAHRENKSFTEDASMLKYYDVKPVHCLKGQPYNIKITEYIDLLYGEIIYKEKFLEDSL